MFKKFYLLFVLIFLGVNIFESCIAREWESRNEYFINNQSSFDLKYSIEIDDMLTNIIILSGNNEKIYSEVVLGGSFSPNIYFESTSEYIGSDIFLKRDSLGLEIKALKLNEDLNWIEKNRDNEFYFELIVTDEMLN